MENRTHPNLVCAITGASSGLGLASALALAARGIKVVMVCRPSSRANVAFSQVSQVANVAPHMIHADLSRPADAWNAADAILRHASSLNVMIHNAGVWPMKRQLTEDGFETAFAVNHLAPFVMNQVLLPRLQATPGARIVQVTAGLYAKGKVALAHTPTGLDFHRLKTYANTKLWNLLATLQLARTAAGGNVAINAVHPGVVRTRLGASLSPVGALLWLVKRFWLSPEVGAQGPLKLALDPGVATCNGQVFNQLQPMKLAAVAQDEALAGAVVAETQLLLKANVNGPASALTSHS